jgi:hypothetical protein
MAEVIHDSPQEFWRSPTILEPLVQALPLASPCPVEACADCRTEFLIGARFCHACGLRRPMLSVASGDATVMAGLWNRGVAGISMAAESVATSWRKSSFPGWLQYLHFHEIQRVIGLPTASLIAFMIGLGCVAGAIGVSLFYKASNLAEFQAIQMWRMEWLLAATASFVAGILLKTSSGNRPD